MCSEIKNTEEKHTMSTSESKDPEPYNRKGQGSQGHGQHEEQRRTKETWVIRNEQKQCVGIDTQKRTRTQNYTKMEKRHGHGEKRETLKDRGKRTHEL